MAITHYGGFSIVSGRVTIKLDLERFADQFRKAQLLLGEQVLADCKIYMPFQTGGQRQRSSTEAHLIDRSRTENDGKQVVFPGPYARFLYGGKVMVDKDTGSPWALPGNKKVVTSKDLTFSQPNATAEWFETAKKRHGQDWITMVKKVAGGGDAG